MDATTTYQLVALTHIAPSPTNPRRHAVNHAVNFKAWALDDLAENIRQHGVIEPVLLRPNPESAHAFDGRPDFELVAGERRWRASQLAGRETIPALVRHLTDLQVLELQLAENIHAQALHPIEEAEHFERLLRAKGGPLNADELAARIGKSASLVRNRLDLLKLCAPVREACLAGEVGASVALEIANGTPPGDDAAQQRALKEAVAGWAGEPFSARSMRAHMRKHYMLRLDHARFDPQARYTNDNGAILGPAPDGKCSDCLKRTGANPDFFTDVKEGDLCQDAVCYNAKTAAARSLLIETARAEGATVIEGDGAARMIASGKPAGHQLLDQPCWAFSDHPKPLREAVGDALASSDLVFIDAPKLEAPLVVVTDATAQRALKSRGLLKIAAPAAPARPATPAKKTPAGNDRGAPLAATDAPKPAVAASNAVAKPEVEAGADITDPLFESALDFKVIPAHVKGSTSITGGNLKRWTEAAEDRARAFMLARAISRTMRSDGAEGFPPELMRLVLVTLLLGDAYVTVDLAAQMAGLPEPESRGWAALNAWAWNLPQEQAVHMVLMLLALQDAGPDVTTKGFPAEVAIALRIEPEPIVAAAKALVRDRLQLELMQRGKPAKPKATSAPGSKKTAAPKSQPKYRNADTGDTWSGRGLPPKWLKVALERGAKLADFEVRGDAPISTRASTAKKAKPVSEDRAPITLKDGSTLSREAAWPFPKAQP